MKNMKSLRIDEIKKLLPNYVEVNKYGNIKVHLYSMIYIKNNIEQLIDILKVIKEIPEYKDSAFEVSYETGYYDQVDDIYLDFSPKN